MSTGTDLGFDLDEETIELFDAILLNLSQDRELSDEFKKLKFVRKLHDNYDGSVGPIKQILIKLAKIEQDYSTMSREHTRIQTDCRRAIEDLTLVCRAIREAAKAKDDTARYNELKKLEGIEFRTSQYSCNHK